MKPRCVKLGVVAHAENPSTRVKAILNYMWGSRPPLVTAALSQESGGEEEEKNVSYYSVDRDVIIEAF